MSDESQTELCVPNNKSRIADVSQSGHAAAIGTSRRSSSMVSLRPRNHSPSPSHRSTAPLTPEESPPSKSTRKRSAGVVEEEDKALSSADVSPAHSRANSGEQPNHVCICQPEPKVPRPRNAFILYRQYYQSSVVAQNPGLANPEISKIIGERWQSLPPEEKGHWKAAAEEEKLRHQQQYPDYRYQPKRNGRRNSLSGDLTGPPGEKPKCVKCGGRTILTPSTPFSIGLGTSHALTPGSSALTPVSRTLPVLRDLSLQSPGPHRLRQQHPSNMSPYHNHPDERDDVGPLSPGNKRRRYNGDHPAAVTRTMPPRYGVATHGIAVGPGTPFPFSQVPPPPHAYLPTAVHTRRESLPGLRGMVSPPGQMAPPPRPGMGYSQHRLSHGHVAPDRSLTLPPIQTAHMGDEPLTTGDAIGMGEERTTAGFKSKLKVLSHIAPPASRTETRRGPLIAIEGDSAEVAVALAEWLQEMLGKDDDLRLNTLESPDVSVQGSKEQMMSQCHRLAADWLSKSSEILAALTVPVETAGDAAMTDVNHGPTSRPASRKPSDADNHDTSDNSDGASNNGSQATDKCDSVSHKKMIVDKRSSTISNASSASLRGPKPVSIVANYSLHASNHFTNVIPLGGVDPYTSNDQWQWAATQWRGIIGPDLTIYVCDAITGESGRSEIESEAAGGMARAALFIVKRIKDDEQMVDSDEKNTIMQLEPSALRRIGFEVSEWVKAFGSRK